MLIVKVYVNEREIDDIHIHNEGYEDDGFWKYRVYHESLLDEEPLRLKHYRENGYMPLLKMALEGLMMRKK